MPFYSEARSIEFEEEAEDASPDEQKQALAIVANILERNGISYGVMGGMNFFIRGSGRVTGDVDIAVDNPPQMKTLLSCFERYSRIYRPADKFQWMGGVARIFVDIRGQMVQVDLKPKCAAGHLVPQNMAAAVERRRITATTGPFNCDLLAIGPVVLCKLKAHSDRRSHDDYIDLMFVCESRQLAPQVRAASGPWNKEWKKDFLEEVLYRDPAKEAKVRWALNMERTPSTPLPTSRPTPGPSGGRGNGVVGSGYASGYHTSSGNRAAYGGGYSSGSRDRGYSGYGGAGQGLPYGSGQYNASYPTSGMRQSSSSGGPRNGDKSSDGYWTFSARYNKWYHWHSNGDYSWDR